ncbi:hypothetical protein BH23BAC3_BH23BAC3_22160 [soil metagenome]
MSKDYFEVPDLITLENFGGSFEAFNEAVYEIFKTDFVDSKPTYRGIRLGLKAHPLQNGKEYTFYHFTHDGRDEQNRQPNLRRMERIRFPRPMIDDSDHPYLKVWRNKRGRNVRILIYHEAESYLVVLEDRGTYILPWTAYLVDRNHTKRKLMKEYEAYKKAEAAQDR